MFQIGLQAYVYMKFDESDCPVDEMHGIIWDFFSHPETPQWPTQRQFLATVEDVMRSQHTCSAPFEILRTAIPWDGVVELANSFKRKVLV